MVVLVSVIRESISDEAKSRSTNYTKRHEKVRSTSVSLPTVHCPLQLSTARCLQIDASTVRK